MVLTLIMKKIRHSQKWLILICGLFWLLQITLVRAETPNATKLLEEVDKHRLGWESVEVNVNITTTTTKGKKTLKQYLVRVAGKERSLVKFLNSEEQGQYLLMRKEGMWMYFPNTRRAIRITPLQRLTGNTSNGDIANLPFSGNYTPQLQGSENVEGIATWVLELNAFSRAATYPKIKIWVKQDNHTPYKAEYYLASGKLMKNVDYIAYEETEGYLVLKTMQFKVPHKPSEVSEMQFTRIEQKSFPAYWFQKNYLPRLPR
jgi:outer membrane lipoprotein-sorting protein